MKTVKLLQAVRTVTPKTKIKAKNFLDHGEFPVVSQEAGSVNGYWDDEKDVMKFDKPVVIFGDHTRAVKYVDFNFVAGADGTKIIEPNDELDSKYLYYWFLANPIKGLGYARHFRILKEKSIQIPALNEQKKIVERLDGAFEKIDLAIELTQKNLQNSQDLFDAELRGLLRADINGVVSSKLGDIAEVEYGLTKKAKPSGEYRLIRITDINQEGLLNHGAVYIDANKQSEKYLLNKGDLLVARTGATFGKVLYYHGSGKAVFASYLIRINLKISLNSRLFWYFAKTRMYWDQANKLASGAAQPQFNGGALKQVVVTYPQDQEDQRRLIEKLDLVYAQTQQLKNFYQEKLEKLQELKQSILEEAFRFDDEV